MPWVCSPLVLDNFIQINMMRDPFYLFDISAAAEFLCDTSKISAFELKFFVFFAFFIYLLGNLGPV
jgi:hypothetical protein